MLRGLFLRTDFRRLWGWAGVAAILGCLVLGGCCGQCCNLQKLRGEKFADNSLGNDARQFRTADKNAEPSAVTTRGQQIEKDFGVGR